VKRFNPRRVKIHRNYTVGEAAMLFRAHKNTVRAWLKSGLPPIDGRRPILILGRQLASFFTCASRVHTTALPTGPVLLFPLPGAEDIGSSKGRLSADLGEFWQSEGYLSECGTRMYRRVSFRKLATAVGDLQVTLPQAQQRIVEGADPSVNCDLEQELDAQPGK
jgi:hypothetical protein